MLAGVVVPLVTPMSSPGVPSVSDAEPLLTAMADAGVRQLMLFGSNGEGPLIRADRTGEFVAGVVDNWRSVGVVLVNVTAPGTDEVRRRAEIAVAAGANALVLSPPTYFRHRDDEVAAHYQALAEFGIPVVAYNAPKYATPLTRSAVDVLIGLSHVVGIKDSSGDLALLEYMIAAAKPRPEFVVSQGDERQLAAALRAGVKGIVPGTANLAPRLALDMMTADDAELDRLQDLTTQLAGLHNVRPGVPSVKALLASWQLCPPHCAPPLAPCTPEELAGLTAVVNPLGEFLLSPH